MEKSAQPSRGGARFFLPPFFLSTSHLVPLARKVEMSHLYGLGGEGVVAHLGLSGRQRAHREDLPTLGAPASTRCRPRVHDGRQQAAGCSTAASPSWPPPSWALEAESGGGVSVRAGKARRTAGHLSFSCRTHSPSCRCSPGPRFPPPARLASLGLLLLPALIAFAFPACSSFFLAVSTLWSTLSYLSSPPSSGAGHGRRVEPRRCWKPLDVLSEGYRELLGQRVQLQSARESVSCVWT